MPVQMSFEPTPPTPGQLLFQVTIPGRLPSWNEILGMEHWARYQFKKQLADSFLYELRRCARDSSTKITSAKSTMLTYAATLESYLETARRQRALRSASKRQSRGLPKKSALKSSESKVPF